MNYNNIYTCQAESNADKLFVETANNLQTVNVVIVSENIDVFFLLTALCPIEREIYFRIIPRSKVSKKMFTSKSLAKSLRIGMQIAYSFLTCFY